ncbi:MAG: divalent-cation tolerance protein CutA [Acidiferrobacter sp.]
MTALVVFSTCPAERATAIATALVDERLAACVNIVSGVRSVYRWAQHTESATEDLLIIKVTTHNYEHLEERLRALHPYALPEILALPVARGLAAYLAWLADPDHR